MTGSVTVQALFDQHRQRLALRWVAGHSGGDRELDRKDVGLGEPLTKQPLVGHFNPIRPHLIQVLGPTELTYLDHLAVSSLEDVGEQLFAAETTVCVIVSDDQAPPPALTRFADNSGVALLCSALPSTRLVEHLQYYVATSLAKRTTLHGVFMEVMGTGVLITGESGVGKSELALELITRGHRLVADDAPEFGRIAPDIVTGLCPPVLQDFLEVRGLGILNVRRLFGDGAIKEGKYLRLIVNLKPMSDEEMRHIDRLEGSRQTQDVLGVEIPVLTLPVAPGRNLAVLVEAAVRSHILLMGGYNATDDFVSTQTRHLAEKNTR